MVANLCVGAATRHAGLPEGQTNASKTGVDGEYPAVALLDPRPVWGHDASTLVASEAITKLQSLSEARASKVYSLIEDLAELEELENAADLKAGREALADPEPTVSYEQLRRDVGLDR